LACNLVQTVGLVCLYCAYITCLHLVIHPDYYFPGRLYQMAHEPPTWSAECESPIRMAAQGPAL
jgi:hypothetical protein